MLPVLLLLASDPCLTATDACRERVEIGARFVNVYRNYSLKTGAPSVQRAVIMIHGAGRNADGYFRTVLASAAVAGHLPDAILISPHFKGREKGRCDDAVEPGELAWPCDGWKGGEAATNLEAGVKAFAFDVVDRLVETLNDRARFPKLATIVIAGHSAGGQYLHRYIAASRAQSALPVRYVVANPSSYLYLNELRLPYRASCKTDGTCSAKFAPWGDRENCTTYNRWRYGLENRTGYAAAVEDQALRDNLVRRDVTYLVGELDAQEDSSLDTTCSARAQGPSRRERGLNYWNYIRSQHGAKHELRVIGGCGHSATCMFASEAGAKVVFP
ncbi:MAG: alpha/beta fold hydrolase [Bryobacteraceae bacterium]